MVTTYKKACKEFKEVLHLLVTCITCGKYLFCVYDPAVRDTCEKCGGKAKVKYEKEII